MGKEQQAPIAVLSLIAGIVVAGARIRRFITAMKLKRGR